MLTAMKLTGSPEALADYHSNEENYYFSQASGSDGTHSMEYVKVHGGLCENLGFKSGQSIDEQTFSNLLHGREDILLLFR